MSSNGQGWADLGLPTPDAGSSSYRIGCGLVRTRYPDGSARQRRTYFHWPRSWQVQWSVTAAQLQTLTSWLNAYGHLYMSIPLVSGEDPAGALIEHQVRLCSDLQVSLSGGLFRVRAELEQAAGQTPADPSGWLWPASLALADDYGYGEDWGFVRTPFAASLARQVRVHTRRPRTFAVHWRLRPGELAMAEAWINAYGFRWFEAALTSSASAAYRPALHRVRCAGDPVVTYLPGGSLDLSLTLEQACADDLGALESEVASYLLICVGGLRGEAIAQASASGDLSSGVALAGAAAGEVDAPGTLDSDLAGDAAAAADAAADWDASLAGDAAARANAYGDLDAKTQLAGDAVGEVDAEGDL